MKAGPIDWLRFLLALTGSIVVIVAVTLLVNFTVDCAPSATECAEPQRRASFVVLGLGLLWLVYLVVRFIRSPTTFR